MRAPSDVVEKIDMPPRFLARLAAIADSRARRPQLRFVGRVKTWSRVLVVGRVS